MQAPQSLAASSVQPLMFGPAEAHLYGCYHSPRDIEAGPPHTAVLICPPVGYEMIRSHRALRILADRLAAAGVAAMRFDYLGTGDSAGEMEDASLAAWLASIQLALAELRRIANPQRLVVVGLRLGASLIFQALRDELLAADGVVLWKPVLKGDLFIQQMKASHSAHMQWITREFGSPPDSANEELLGYRWSSELLNDVRQIDLASVQQFPASTKVLLLNDAQLPSDDLAARLRALGSAVEVAELSEPVAWNVEPHLAAFPHQAMQRILTWITGSNRD